MIKHPVSQLQESLQKKYKTTQSPLYWRFNSSSPPFIAKVDLVPAGLSFVGEPAGSKADAKLSAALAALEWLKKEEAAPIPAAKQETIQSPPPENVPIPSFNGGVQREKLLKISVETLGFESTPVSHFAQLARLFVDRYYRPLNSNKPILVFEYQEPTAGKFVATLIISATVENSSAILQGRVPSFEGQFVGEVADSKIEAEQSAAASYLSALINTAQQTSGPPHPLPEYIQIKQMFSVRHVVPPMADTEFLKPGYVNKNIRQILLSVFSNLKAHLKVTASDFLPTRGFQNYPYGTMAYSKVAAAKVYLTPFMTLDSYFQGPWACDDVHAARAAEFQLYKTLACGILRWTDGNTLEWGYTGDVLLTGALEFDRLLDAMTCDDKLFSQACSLAQKLPAYINLGDRYEVVKLKEGPPPVQKRLKLAENEDLKLFWDAVSHCLEEQPPDIKRQLEKIISKRFKEAIVYAESEPILVSVPDPGNDKKQLLLKAPHGKTALVQKLEA